MASEQRSGRVGSILVLGNAGVDLSMPVPRLPRPGETLTGGPVSRAPGGKGLNQAVVAARAGAPVRFLAAAGPDAEADFIRTALAGEPLQARLIKLAQPTDLSLILVDRRGENSIVTSGACAAALPADLAAQFGATARPGDILLLQGNLSQAATLAGMAAARERGARVMLNTAPLQWDLAGLLPSCDVVVANAGEAEAITREPDPALAAQSLHGAGAMVAIVTCGAAGCVWADDAGSHHAPASPTTVVDTTGAGDTFCGILAAALIAGSGLGAAIQRASRAAAVTVSRPGAFTALPATGELLELGELLS